MEYEKDFFDGEKIPDFALQPAKPASALEPASAFDATVYDKLFESLSQQVNATIQTEQPAEPISAERSPEAEPFRVKPVAVEEQEAEPVASAGLQELEATEPEELPDSGPVAAEDFPEAEAVVSAELSEGDPIPVAEEPAAELTAAAAPPSDGGEAFVAPVAAVTPIHMAPKSLPVHVEVASGGQQNKKVKYTDFRRLSPVVINVEEDILITDTKPDMVQILGAEGICQLAERSVSTGAHGAQSIRITGDLKVQTLYMAENDDDEPLVVSVDTKVLFREDCMVKGEADADIALRADLRSIECERVNERKFRVRAAVEVSMREYCEKEMELFDGIEKEELQFLQDEIEFTDIAMRRTEIMEVSEEIRLREGSPEIDKILCFNVSVAENHKQISGEKAMINASVYLNVLYKSDGCPVFYKCKTEFTQFMRIDGGGFGYPLIAGRVFFDILDCTLTAKRDEEGRCSILCLNMEVETTLEYYRQIQEPCITDMYHYSKDVQFDRTAKELNCFCGSATVDIPMREIVDIPDRYGNAEQVIYVSGSPKIKSQTGQQGKIMVEGVLPVKLICIGGESGKLPFAIDQEMEFRASLDIPDCRAEAEPDCQVAVKELWFDQINNRQIAVNGEIAVSGYVFEKTAPELIQTVSLIERDEKDGPNPSIIVYAAKPGDTVWKVAKKYHTPMSKIRTVNDLADREEIGAGSKILIVR